VLAFQKVGINASYDEDTPDSAFQKNVDTWDALTEERKKLVGEALVNLAAEGLESFLRKLELTVSRRLKAVRIAFLYGRTSEFGDAKQAMEFISAHAVAPATEAFVKFELTVEFTNGDRVNGTFTGKEAATSFLKTFLAF